VKHSLLFRAFGFVILLQLTGGVAADRNVVVISDLHMGVGQTMGNKWDPTEDFRWAAALDGFLKNLAERLPKTDLVLAGDIFELWQPRDEEACEGKDADHGCTVQEMEKILERSLDAHAAELKSIDAFAGRDGNCVFFIPGNHDAVLVIDSLWKQVRSRFLKASCVKREADGVWESASRKIVVEHGHQIGSDSNAYSNWPKIVREIDGKKYIERTWGEWFVQSLFNKEEAELPLIDNLTPHTAGVRYKIQHPEDLGTIENVAMFLRFNLLETSLRQKIQSLGKDERGNPQWNLEQGRELGYELFLGALDPKDPFAIALQEDTVDSSWGKLRAELSKQAKALPNQEVRSLCDQIAMRGYKPDCADETLGAAIESVLFSREHITRRHVKKHSETLGKMELFIYGHTHAFELKWSAKVDDLINVNVINTGAFQRLVDDARLRALAAQANKRPVDLLEGSLDALDACYTFAEIPNGDVRLAQLRAWIMEEDDAEGRILSPCDKVCPNSGAGCPE